LPEYNILFESRLYKVELAKKEGMGLFEARVNGKPVEVRVEENDTGSLSPLTLQIAGKPYRAELAKIDRNSPFPLTVNGTHLQAQFRKAVREVDTPMPAVSVATKGERRRITSSQEGVISAPMAGRIVSVRVKKGDAVKVGDVICILEAMKMENEINATKDGTVQEVNVSEGSPVSEGDVLATIA
jgi:biotin carboxyl carrier protein